MSGNGGSRSGWQRHGARLVQNTLRTSAKARAGNIGNRHSPARERRAMKASTLTTPWSDGYLAERHRQQARAEQHEAGRRQGKKSVGDNVVVAHETPTDQMLFRIY